MNSFYKAVIVGGGASGLLCAVELVKLGVSGKDILILEKKDRVGKKLLATGNGQCNLTNADISAKHYYGDASFILEFFNSNKPQIKEYFNDLCLPLLTDDEGRCYPLSKQASSVLDIIRIFLSKNNVNIITDEEVVDVKRIDNGFIVLGKNEYFAQNVVLAFGGKAQKQFGTEGTSYKLATKFSHKLTTLYPSIVQLKTEKDRIKGLKGLKERVRVCVKGSANYKEGDLLFTDFGVSGDSIFRISPLLSGKENQEIVVEFLPQLDVLEVEKIVKQRLDNGFCGEQILNGLINKKIGLNVIKDIKVLNAKNIAFAVKNFTLKIFGTLGFDYAQVTKGGIDCKDIYANTFESKLVNGLYVLGEALNVDGDCGGFNLDFAFSSGIMSARAIVNKNNK